MRTRSFGIVLASACLATLSLSPSSAATPQSPFLGKWELDLTRMPETYGPPPKRVTFTFQDVGSEQWRTTVEITGGDDSVRHMAVQYRRDGRDRKSTRLNSSHQGTSRMPSSA